MVPRVISQFQPGSHLEPGGIFTRTVSFGFEFWRVAETFTHLQALFSAGGCGGATRYDFYFHCLMIQPEVTRRSARLSCGALASAEGLRAKFQHGLFPFSIRSCILSVIT